MGRTRRTRRARRARRAVQCGGVSALVAPCRFSAFRERICSALSVLSALSLLSATPLTAQKPVQAAGRIVRITDRDTVSVPGVRVVLHRVGRAVQGPVDSVVAGANGQFRFRYPADTAAVYLLSTGWQGIEYFSSPLHTEPGAPDTGLVVVVSDTSSSAPVSIVSRHLVISKPTSGGSRPVLEIIVLANTGNATRVSADSTQPTWEAGLPAGAVNFEAGSGDFSGEALEAGKDRVRLFAPIAPGEKQVIYTYALPAGTGPVRITVPDSIGIFNVLLEEFDRSVRGGGLVKADSQQIEGRSFRQWAGPAPAGSVVVIDFPGAGAGAWLLPGLVGTLALVLAVVAVRVLKRRPAESAQGSALDRLARLDARFAGKEGSVPAEEWQQYQSERARLKAEVSAQLARSRPPA